MLPLSWCRAFASSLRRHSEPQQRYHQSIDNVDDALISLQSGCARLSSKLARERPREVGPHSDKLLKVLLAATKKSRTAPMRREYAGAVAAVMAIAPSVRTRLAAP